MSSLGRVERRTGLLVAGGFGLLVAALASLLPEPPLLRAARGLAFGALFLPPLLLAVPAWRRAAGRWLEHPATRWLFGAALLAVLAAERAARGRLEDVAGTAAYVLLPLLATADRRRSAAPRWRDLALVLLLWLPLELKWVTGDFILLRLLGLDLLLLLYLAERPVFELGRLLPAGRREWTAGLAAWLVFLAVAIPIALATGFAAPGLSARSAGGWALFVFSTYTVIALPEEALFRGAMQTLLQRALRRPWLAVGIAAVVFGLSHLNNGPPDWRYVLLASLAGIAYGEAFRRTGNLAAPTLTHFLVDVTWRGFFAGNG